MILVLHALWTPISVFLFVLLARPRENPLAVVAAALCEAAATRGGRLVLAIGVATLAVDGLECLAEPWIARALGYDLTAWVASIEGDLVERVQRTLPPALAAPLGWFYLSGFVAGLLLPPIAWAAEGRVAATRAVVAAFVASYALALPFYVFFPVREVGWSALSGAQPLLERVYPGLSGDIRLGSALDNCFPSLHVSLTVTAFAVALAFRDRGVAWVTGVVSALTAYTVIALGIHWALDVAAALPFGLACAWIGVAWSRRVERARDASAP